MGNLEQFLEAKRGQFPRFYFLSNEDLLEIIGQSKDPKPILKHVGKIFEGIHTLNYETGGTKNNRIYDINALVSEEGEEIPIKTIQVEAKVESWLKKVINEMKDGLRKLFYQYYSQHMQGTKKQLEREKLMAVIKKFPGQVLLTCAS